MTLSPAQTVALYGTEINVRVRRSGLDESSDVTFHYAFPLKSVGNQAQGGGFTSSSSFNGTVGQGDKGFKWCI